MTRPARPFLCIALARETQQVSRLAIFWLELKRVSFIFPVSMTNTQSSIVTEVSAILVLNTIFRTPAFVFRKTRFCSSLDKLECNGIIKYFPVFEDNVLLAFRLSRSDVISASPGKKTLKSKKKKKEKSNF